MNGLRVTSTDDRLTKHVRSWVGAAERARRLALLMGASQIEQRQRDGAWSAVETFVRVGTRVTKGEGRR